MVDIHAFTQIAEHLEHIFDPAPEEPERRKKCGDKRYDQINHIEVSPPPFDRPGRKSVPDDDEQKTADEFIEK